MRNSTLNLLCQIDVTAIRSHATLKGKIRCLLDQLTSDQLDLIYKRDSAFIADFNSIISYICVEANKNTIDRYRRKVMSEKASYNFYNNIYDNFEIVA